MVDSAHQVRRYEADVKAKQFGGATHQATNEFQKTLLVAETNSYEAASFGTAGASRFGIS